MHTILNPYINFNGNAREALEFYKNVLGGDLKISTFKSGSMPHDPADAEKIMHGMLTVSDGMTLMAADTPPGMPYNPGTNISISLSGDNEKELNQYWSKLADGATVLCPLAKAPWGDTFGMLTDKFGIVWLVNIAPAKAVE